MSQRVAWALVAVLLGAAASAGCGDDAPDHDGADSDGGVRRPRSTRGSGGAAGRGTSGAPAAGSGGSGRGASGRVAPPPPGPIECGSTQCTPAPDSFNRACCLDADTSTCGVLVAGLCIEPLHAERGCPPLDFPGLIMLPSCCTSRGMCGIDATSVGVPGCLDLATAAERARMSGASVVFPAPRACDELDAGMDDDAGM